MDDSSNNENMITDLPSECNVLHYESFTEMK